jgi:DNA-binding NarL/FixJ family response regulator
MKSGAAGYLLKEISIDEIGQSVRNVHRGQRLVTPSLAAKLITEFAGIARRPVDRRIEPPQLTPREVEVLRHVADGGSNRMIAGQMGISENTVKNHVRNILEKLRLHSRMEAVLYAVRENLLDLP